MAGSLIGAIFRWFSGKMPLFPQAVSGCVPDSLAFALYFSENLTIFVLFGNHLTWTSDKVF